MNPASARLRAGFFVPDRYEDEDEEVGLNPAYLCDGPYESERNPDTFELSPGCYRRLPCGGGDDSF